MTALATPKSKRAPVSRKAPAVDDHPRGNRKKMRPAKTRILKPVNKDVSKKSKNEKSKRPGSWIGLFSETKDF